MEARFGSTASVTMAAVSVSSVVGTTGETLTTGAPGLELTLMMIEAAQTQSAASEAETTATARASRLRTHIPDQVIESRGRVVFRGTIDLTESIRRIRAGERHPHRRDGGVFQNRERRLPLHPRGYYREWVHPTAGERGPGPQRLVTGRSEEWYYTPDHYRSFIPLHQDVAP